jgi:hypothetical protein
MDEKTRKQNEEAWQKLKNTDPEKIRQADRNQRRRQMGAWAKKRCLRCGLLCGVVTGDEICFSWLPSDEPGYCQCRHKLKPAGATE